VSADDSRHRGADLVGPGGCPPGRSRLWTVEDTADYLGVPVKTLYDWRNKGVGPRSSKVGRYVRYRPEDVDRWLDDKAA